jgi:hypothetical protein
MDSDLEEIHQGICLHMTFNTNICIILNENSIHLYTIAIIFGVFKNEGKS